MPDNGFTRSLVRHGVPDLRLICIVGPKRKSPSRLADVPHLCYTWRGNGGDIVNKSATVRARVEPELKNNAEAVFRRLGLNPTQAITIFYRQVELRDGLPFEVVMPTNTTRRTFEATDAGRDIVICEDADDMFEKLSI